MFLFHKMLLCLTGKPFAVRVYEYSNCLHENSTNQVHPNEMCVMYCVYAQKMVLYCFIRFSYAVWCMNKIDHITYNRHAIHFIQYLLYITSYVLFCTLDAFSFLFQNKFSFILYYRYTYYGCMVRTTPHTAYGVRTTRTDLFVKGGSSKEQDIFMCIIIITLHLTIVDIEHSYGC